MTENKSQTLSCAGGDYAKHPRVYFLVKHDKVTLCPYCSKDFQDQNSASSEN